MKAKKQKRNLYTTNKSQDLEYSKIIKITLGVVVVLVIMYFITAILMGEIKFNKKENVKEVETSIQYDEIIVGEIFNRPANEYYVLLTDFTDIYTNYYSSLINSYLKKDNSLPFYYVDLEKKINNNYKLKEGEKLVNNPSNISEFKAEAPTIVKIKDKKVVERIAGNDNIIQFFEK